MQLNGENINELARVLRIIDVFDAMTSERPYKKAIPPLEAAKIMTRVPENGGDEEKAGDDRRDAGMRQSFDEKLLRKFILFLGDMRLSE